LNHRRLLLLSFVSALLSYLGFRVEAVGSPEALTLVFFEYSPGVFFGALVLVPMASEGSGVWWRRIRLMIVSVLIYYIAFQIAVDPGPKHLVGIVLYSSAGLLGALGICFACRFIIPQRLSFMQIMMASLAGVVGGASIGMISQDWLPSWGGHFSFISGFVIWQMGVAFALFSGYFLGSEASNKPVQGSLNNPN